MDDAENLLLQTARFRVVERHQSTHAGAPARARQIVVHPGSVLIVPIVEGDQVCLIRNFRIAVNKTLIELPAGTIESNDAPVDIARRELQEETGYTAATWRPLASFQMSPGILDECIHAFVAADLTPGPPAREPGEEIENYLTPWPEAIAMALDGRIVDAKSICALLLWDRLREGIE